MLLTVRESGADAIHVVGVVVVGVAIVVDIPEIRRVTNIGRAKPPVVSGDIGYNQLFIHTKNV